ncbi:MAG TPA: PHP domain-containing protein [Halanaerobiales bacterium]|nr:PHP domain-containing protein [Halanaerobiales bacterium]
MGLFKYETHAHTAEGSKCSKISAVELVHIYKRWGYSGICITDHFLNGNTTVPEVLPWTERIELFCRGYEKAYAEGEEIGIEVFFGWEYSYKGTDILTYGLDKEWLLSHPGLLGYSINEYCDLAHNSGGLLVHAHPFREAEYIAMIRLLPRRVDTVEVINACRTDFKNERALEYANNYNLLKLAGSDTHRAQIESLAGIQAKRKLGDIDDMIKVIKDGQAEVFSEKSMKM